MREKMCIITLLQLLFVSYLLFMTVFLKGEIQQRLYRKVSSGHRLTNDHIKSNHSVSSVVECGSFSLQGNFSGFSYKARKKRKEINCQLATSLTSLTNDDSWAVYENDPSYEYGTKHNPGKSCYDILKTQRVQDRLIYWISLEKTAATAFPVFCDMENGGWTLIFKVIDDVPGTLSNVWQSQSTFEENSLEALNVDNTFKNHYKNRIVQEWDTFKPTQARVVLYSQREEDLALTFNAQNTDNLDWFAEANLETSPWQDIHTITDKNYFSLRGACTNPQMGCRNFYINHHHGGCEADTGWLCIGNLKGCDWEKRQGESSFLYSNNSTAVNWHNSAAVGVSEVFAVYLR